MGPLTFWGELGCITNLFCRCWCKSISRFGFSLSASQHFGFTELHLRRLEILTLTNIYCFYAIAFFKRKSYIFLNWVTFLGPGSSPKVYTLFMCPFVLLGRRHRIWRILLLNSFFWVKNHLSCKRLQINCCMFSSVVPEKVQKGVHDHLTIGCLVWV